MNNAVLETDRLYLRRLCENDLEALAAILEDERVMYAYEGAFTRQMTASWLARQLARYENDGFGLWGVILKETESFIGQCGVTLQQIPEGTVPEVGYLLRCNCWHKGYASEAAIACRNYAFDVLREQEVYSIIRDTNVPSQRVAERMGMTLRGNFIKHYRGVDMPHVIYSVTKKERDSLPGII